MQSLADLERECAKRLLSRAKGAADEHCLRYAEGSVADNVVAPVAEAIDLDAE